MNVCVKGECTVQVCVGRVHVGEGVTSVYVVHVSAGKSGLIYTGESQRNIPEHISRITPVNHDALISTKLG